MINKGDKHIPMLGGQARASSLTPEQRTAIARKARAQRTANYNKNKQSQLDTRAE